LADIKVPASTIGIGETLQPYTNVWIDNAAYGQNVGGHSGMSNWLFLDGHVKAMKHSATNKTENMWTREEDGAWADATFNGKLAAADDFLN
jgi:prepilin-type processing-associated H-X9-DG protein